MPISFYKIAIFLFIFLSPIILSAQKYLVFDKPGAIKRVRFYEGEVIRFKTNQQKKFIRDEILEIRQPYLIMSTMGQLHVDSITHFSIQKNSGFSKFRSITSSVLLTAGFGYLLIDGFNNAINDYEIMDRGTLGTSLSMIAVGLIIKPWANRNFRIKNNKRLFIIDMDSGIN